MSTHSRNLKQFCLIVLGGLINCALSAHAAFLDVNDRPEKLRAAITKKYRALVDSESLHWRYNGADKYRIAGVDDDAVVKKLVDTNPQQKIFNLVDVGAGNHSWAQARVTYLNSEFSGQEIHFNIFSLTGDNYKEDGYEERAGVNVVEEQIGVCSLYKLSAFPVENLIEKFKELGYFEMLSNQVDLTVSAYTLMHLVDPVGTFLQMYNLARPNQGLLLVENFFGMSGHDNDPVNNFLDQTQLEFFKRYGTNSFVVRRGNEEGKFPYTYKIEQYDSDHARATLEIALGNEGIQTNPKNTLKAFWQDRGSESLRDWLPNTHPPVDKYGLSGDEPGII